jgi:hypothetical protein
MQTETFNLPRHWASALINGDYSGYEDEDVNAIMAFTVWMVAEYHSCWCISCGDDEDDFRWYHDATRFGVLACMTTDFVFDVTP